MGDITARGMAAMAEKSKNKVKTISEQSTNEEYPSAKCVFNAINSYDMPRYGINGIGESLSALTRLWDASGMTATPGTDTTATKSDFDGQAPFNWQKCVGDWAEGNGKAVFTPRSFYGDADYTEDGSIGDYVAVDITPWGGPVYWYHSADEKIVGVSAGPHPGWEVHPICIDYSGNIRAHTYLPCYPLSVNGESRAVSLPGYHNAFGGYKDLWDKARTYKGGGLSQYAILEPSIANHFMWLMMTIEYATQNMQNIMNGATSMRYTTDTVSLTAESTNSIVVTGSIGDNYVIGQTIYIGSTYSDTPANQDAYNVITAIQKCDENGALNESGTYRLITLSGTARNVTAATTQIGSRPWITGACTGAAPGVSKVLGHTGSPISNSSGKYPCMYRWRENPYGNQNMTAGDLMNVRVAVGETFKLQWYYNKYLTPSVYYPATTTKPDETDLQNAENGWAVMKTETPSTSYADGYIKTQKADIDNPCVLVPVETSGGSATSFWSDYAYLVYSYVVRAVRRRGYVNYGPTAGPWSVSAPSSPANAFWIYGGGLFLAQ